MIMLGNITKDAKLETIRPKLKVIRCSDILHPDTVLLSVLMVEENGTSPVKLTRLSITNEVLLLLYNILHATY